MVLENQQIREYEPITGRNVALGAAAQVLTWDITLSAPTNMVVFGLSEGVTTVPANDPLVAACYTNVSIVVNGTYEVVRDFTRAEYINVVQNLETKEADLISNGAKQMKMFDPPLPAGAKLTVTLTVNTLALATTTPAATGLFQATLQAYDAQKMDFKKVLRIYQRIPAFPQPAGVVANTDSQQDLGTENKIVRYLIMRELTGGALSDTFSGRFELLHNGNTVARMQVTDLKKHYQIVTDGLAVPVGYHLLKMPGPGYNAASSQTLNIRARPHTTVANGQWDGFQILEKAYT